MKRGLLIFAFWSLACLTEAYFLAFSAGISQRRSQREIDRFLESLNATQSERNLLIEREKRLAERERLLGEVLSAQVLLMEKVSRKMSKTVTHR